MRNNGMELFIDITRNEQSLINEMLLEVNYLLASSRALFAGGTLKFEVVAQKVKRKLSDWDKRAGRKRQEGREGVTL